MSREAKILTAVLVAIVGGMIGLFVLANNNDSGPSADKGNRTAGELTSTGPWDANTSQLATRLAALQLGAEGNALHIHQHLDIRVKGKVVPVPKNIGINTSSGVISPLHIHDDNGIVHVESGVKRTFTLGELMTVWGVKFDQTHLGGNVVKGDDKLKVFRNGVEVSGDPQLVALSERDEIVVTFGADSQLPQPIPSSYDFPKDL